MPKWIQRDGTPIEVRDMADSHLTNAIKMLARKKHVAEVLWYFRLRDELRGRIEQHNHEDAMQAFFDPWGDD